MRNALFIVCGVIGLVGVGLLFFGPATPAFYVGFPLFTLSVLGFMGVNKWVK